MPAESTATPCGEETPNSPARRHAARFDRNRHRRGRRSQSWRRAGWLNRAPVPPLQGRIGCLEAAQMSRSASSHREFDHLGPPEGLLTLTSRTANAIPASFLSFEGSLNLSSSGIIGDRGRPAALAREEREMPRRRIDRHLLDLVLRCSPKPRPPNPKPCGSPCHELVDAPIQRVRGRDIACAPAPRSREPFRPRAYCCTADLLRCWRRNGSRRAREGRRWRRPKRSPERGGEVQRGERCSRAGWARARPVQLTLLSFGFSL